MKRFYRAAEVREGAGGWTVALDGRPVMTPARAHLALPTPALAAAVAAEWDGQGERVRPETMPLTRAANSAIDRVVPERAAVAMAVARYGESDLLCYRAEAPEGLVERQKALWDPLLGWAAETLGARLLLAEGVIHVAQPEPALARLREAVAAHDAWGLTALHETVTLTGSLVIGLALSHGAVATETAWEAGRVDEAWNAEQWGEDAEAAARAAARKRDFDAAIRLMRLLGG